MDTAKCAGVSCPIRDGCDRFVRPAVDGQRWIEPVWCSLPSPRIGYPHDPGGSKSSCMDWKKVRPVVVEPHGGAREEGDGS